MSTEILLEDLLTELSNNGIDICKYKEMRLLIWQQLN